MAYQLSHYEGNCSLSLQNCASLYPKISSLAYGPLFTAESCVPYPFYPTGDVGICGWKGAPCAADVTGRTNCNAALGSCIYGVCSGALGDPCTGNCLGIIQCGTDSRCGGTGAPTNVYSSYGIPVAELCMSGVVDTYGRCTAPSPYYTPPSPSSPSSQLPSSISRSLPSSSSITNLPGGQVGTQTAFEALQKCAPCGKSQCSFTPQATPSSAIYSVIIGNPVANCQVGNNQSVKTRYRASMQIEETWSVDLSMGLAVQGLNIGGGKGWSKSKTIEASQEVELTVMPGQLGALVANVSYKTTSGNMLIDSSSLGFHSIQPLNVLNYAVQYVDCETHFNAVTLNSVNCTSGKISAANIRAIPRLPIFVVFLGLLVAI